MLTRQPSRIATATLSLLLGLFCACPLARTGHAADDHARSVIIWVQEVHGQSQYWVNDTPRGRAPLTGVVAASNPEGVSELTVILDSRVPIHELGEIEGLVPKIDPKDVHYYVFDRAHPDFGMSEIIWKSQNVPLPASPPRIRSR